MPVKSSKETVFRLVGQIPCGQVATYGQIARLAGVKSARPIGNWLHRHGRPISQVPCHRVVNAKGGLAKNFGAKGKSKTQRKRLIAEGVRVKNKRVDLQNYGWKN